MAGSKWPRWAVGGVVVGSKWPLLGTAATAEGSPPLDACVHQELQPVLKMQSIHHRQVLA